MVALLDTWPGADQAAAIEYADRLLNEWPDAVRIAPWSWCKAASKGTVQPSWQLVRALQLTTNHLSKGTVSLARLAHHAKLDHITELEIPLYSDFQEISFLYHRPETFPALKRLRAADKFRDGDVRALADSPIWRTLERFESDALTDSLVHRQDASRIVPEFDRPSRIQHLTLRAPDLIAVWDADNLPNLRSASIFIRSIDEALALAARDELSRLTSLSIAFRCGFSGSSPFEPFLGNIIEPDEAAADAFFSNARLNQLDRLAIVGYSMGYWGREGMGRLGLDALIASGLLQRLKHLRLQLLPLGDKGVAALAPALGKQLETLELPDVYCKGVGAAALIDSPCMSSLRRLDLSANRIDAEHVVQMADVHMPHLHNLDLSGPGVNPYYMHVGQQPVLDAGAEAWANSANAERLRRLNLRNCFLTDEALTAIFQSSQLRTLTELDLSHNSFTAGGISQAVVGSPLWRTLKELGLNDCSLDNAAIEALSQVSHAPALRLLELGYNSIGPKGAAALANWSVLDRVWHLDLHDNVIGDKGLTALAESPHLGRLLELDFEQDCWNSRTFTFNENAATALANSRSLPRLDSMFSGCVDEYHGTAYSPGFTKDGLDAVRRSEWMRPAFKAACSDFSGIDEYFESGEFNEEAELDDHDFRGHPFTLIDREAEATEHRMRQVRLPEEARQAFDDQEPPNISPYAPETDADDTDIIEGIEFLDATPTIDHYLKLDLSLEDGQRPLPDQVGKFLSDTLGSVLKACSLGHFDSTSASSREDENGRMIPTDVGFSVGIKGDPHPAVQLVREALWWGGAPEDTDLVPSAQTEETANDEFSLALTEEPARAESRFLQLVTLKIARWEFSGEPSHRIDRVPFSTEQREGIQRILTEVSAASTNEGWVEVTTQDGGRVAIYVKYLDESDDFEALNLLVEVLTPEISGLVHKLIDECAFMLLPMAFAANDEVAGTIDCDWPRVEIVESAERLHGLLARGPYHWWRHAEEHP